MSEIGYSFSRRTDTYNILNLIKGFLNGNEFDEIILWERLKTLEKEGQRRLFRSLISRQRWGIHSSYQKIIFTAAASSLVALLSVLSILGISCL